MKRRIKKSQNVAKGMPSAVLLSILIHAGLFLLATMLVVFTVINVQEPEFEAPKAVERPKMKLKKPKVRVKTPSKPKSTAKIMTKSTRTSMPAIELPAMDSMMGEDVGDILGDFDMPELSELSVLGSGQTIGNDFEGRLYDLKYDRNRQQVPMDRDQCMLTLRDYARSGWRESVLGKYWRSPNTLYTTHFMIPPIVSPLAPDAFGCPHVESYFFFIKYEGKLVYKEDIKFRFWGTGDAYLSVYVDGKDVFLNGWDGRLDVLDYWHYTDAQSDNFFLGNQQMHVGDWIELKAGEPVDMKLFFGEWEGGIVAGMLLVEVEGVEYPKTRQGGPLLPVFKTEEFTLDQLEAITRYLPEGECSLTNGPIFRDY